MGLISQKSSRKQYKTCLRIIPPKGATIVFIQYQPLRVSGWGMHPEVLISQHSWPATSPASMASYITKKSQQVRDANTNSQKFTQAYWSSQGIRVDHLQHQLQSRYTITLLLKRTKGEKEMWSMLYWLLGPKLVLPQFLLENWVTLILITIKLIEFYMFFKERVNILLLSKTECPPNMA